MLCIGHYTPWRASGLQTDEMADSSQTPSPSPANSGDAHPNGRKRLKENGPILAGTLSTVLVGALGVVGAALGLAVDLKPWDYISEAAPVALWVGATFAVVGVYIAGAVAARAGARRARGSALDARRSEQQ